MKFLIYGSNGWIGQQLLKELDKNNITYIEGKVRAINQTELRNEIKEVNPTHIISLIGRTHGRVGDKGYTTIDYLQDPSKISENIRDNLYSPIVLAIICEKLSIHFTYFGTGCLFEYDELHPFGNEAAGFKDSDVPNFFGSNYSTVKGYTDRLMHLFDNTLNLRIRMCLTPENNWRNFITKLVTYEKICSIPNSMTVLPELIPLVIDMAINKTTGTVNLTNPGLITHNEILEMYKEIVDPTFTWKNMNLDEQTNLLAAGRSNNYLDPTRLQELYPNVKHIKNEILNIDYPNTVMYNCFDPVGTIDHRFCETIHNKFINDVKNNEIDKWRTSFNVWKTYPNERVSVNCVSWLGKTFYDLRQVINSESIIDEENWLSVDAPRDYNRYNVIYNDAIVAHYAFYTQRQKLDEETDILQKYKDLTELI